MEFFVWLNSNEAHVYQDVNLLKHLIRVPSKGKNTNIKIVQNGQVRTFRYTLNLGLVLYRSGVKYYDYYKKRSKKNYRIVGKPVRLKAVIQYEDNRLGQGMDNPSALKYYFSLV